MKNILNFLFVQKIISRKFIYFLSLTLTLVIWVVIWLVWFHIFPTIIVHSTKQITIFHSHPISWLYQNSSTTTRYWMNVFWIRKHGFKDQLHAYTIYGCKLFWNSLEVILQYFIFFPHWLMYPDKNNLFTRTCASLRGLSVTQSDIL